MKNLDHTSLFYVLETLNQISAALNQPGGEDATWLQAILQRVVAGIAGVVSSSSAVVYTCDPTLNRNEAGNPAGPAGWGWGAAAGLKPDDVPRPDGLGMRAVLQGRRVLSYEEIDLQLQPARLAQGARATACYPLTVSGEILGVLYVYLDRDAAFSELELLTLVNFANLAALALAAGLRSNLAQQEQARREKELRRLRRAGMLISSRASLKDTLEVILRMALEVMDAQYGIFRLVDQSGTHLVTQAIAGERLGKPAVETLPIDGHSIMGLVAMTREPVVVADLRQDPWNHIYYPFDRELVMRSELAVPLLGAGGRLEGVLNLESPQLDAFSRQDRYMLQILATQAVAAIQEARLLDALQEISALLLSQSPADMHRSLVEKACDLLNVPTSLIWLVEGQSLVLQAAAGPGAASAQRFPLESTLTAQAIRAGKPLSIGAAGIEQAAAPDSLAALEEGGSALIVPLYAAGKAVADQPVGAFSVYGPAGGGPREGRRDFEQSDWDTKVLSILGHYAMLSIQNAARQEALQSAQEQRAVAETFAAVGDIASNLMHQLNNKIGTIPVRVEGIQDKSAASLAQDAYLAKNLEEIERSAAVALEIMRDTLFHLRPVQFSQVCIADSVGEALAAAHLPPGVEVRQHGLDELPCVSAGPRRLALVFVNLLENAAEAMGGAGVIEIHGRAHERWIQVRVSDNGPGIPAELHERIFEFNYSSRAKETPGKLGFGLWWVKTLIARYGGRVSVESDGRSGTTFILELPRTEAKR